MLPPRTTDSWFLDPELQALATNVYTCYEEGNIPGAIAYLDHAIERFPQYAYLHSERGHFRKLLHDYQGAIADYSQAIHLDPLNALLRLWRSRVYAHLGESLRAAEDYHTAIHLNPSITLYNALSHE